MPALFSLPFIDGNLDFPYFIGRCRTNYEVAAELEERALHPDAELTDRVRGSRRAVGSAELKGVSLCRLFSEAAAIVDDAEVVGVELKLHPTLGEVDALFGAYRFGSVDGVITETQDGLIERNGPG